MDVFLLIFFVAVVAGAVAVNVKILLHYQQPEDSGFASGLLSKVCIVVSLTLAWVLNVMLPIDVRNSRPMPGFLDMQLLWKAAFITLASFLVVVVPGAMLYAEIEGDDTVKKKRRYVLCNLLVTLFLVAAAVGISYPFLSNAAIPVVEYSCDSWLDADAATPPDVLADSICAAGSKSKMEIQVGFDIYIIAVLCFIGWFFFAIFGGIGLSAVPLDMILEFVDRPKAINQYAYQQRRKVLGQAAQALLGRAEELQEREGELAASRSWAPSRQKSQLKAEYNKFKRDVLLLETEFDKLVVSKFNKGENLAVSIIKLLMGILFAILSIIWILHIFLGIILPHLDPNISVPFLGAIFSACESSGAYPVGVALFAVFSLYLLLCVVKGCLKFGMRFFFVLSIHPMRRQGTPLNSILFNVEMVLLSSAAVVQFTQTAFKDYARLTDADVIFSAQIKYMSFYSYFFENLVFIYMLMAFWLIALVYLLVRPRDSGELKFDKKADAALAKMVGARSLAEAATAPLTSQA
mmetsp:Transcript_30550/g.81037  ORF Transcript_30550/g.81037 Transcript_30550/m.81037 type:complete len:520 (+) Transcript_30550:3-1562(+)